MTRKSIHLKDGESQSLFQQKVLCNKKLTKVQYVLSNCHNPYFSRRFFAIKLTKREANEYVCHNPYFSRRFFAMKNFISEEDLTKRSQSLFQQKVLCNIKIPFKSSLMNGVTILILVEGSLQQGNRFMPISLFL